MTDTNLNEALETGPVERLTELLWNMHDEGCASLKEEVVTHPKWCDCNVARALAALSQIEARLGELESENEILVAQFDAAVKAYQDRVAELEGP